MIFYHEALDAMVISLSQTIAVVAITQQKSQCLNNLINLIKVLSWSDVNMWTWWRGERERRGLYRTCSGSITTEPLNQTVLVVHHLVREQHVIQ